MRLEVERSQLSALVEHTTSDWSK